MNPQDTQAMYDSLDALTEGTGLNVKTTKELLEKDGSYNPPLSFDEKLDEILERFDVEHDYLEAKQAIIEWHSKQVDEVLDRAKQRFHEPIEHDGSYISISVIDKTFDELIQAERALIEKRMM